MSKKRGPDHLSADVTKVLNAFGAKNTGQEISTTMILGVDAANYVWNVASLAVKAQIIGAIVGNYGLGIHYWRILRSSGGGF